MIYSMTTTMTAMEGTVMIVVLAWAEATEGTGDPVQLCSEVLAHHTSKDRRGDHLYPGMSSNDSVVQRPTTTQMETLRGLTVQ